MEKQSLLSIFAFEDYRDFLKALAESERGKITKMATAAQCERSYFSRVISADVHLTPDQAFRLSESIVPNPSDQEYFLLLVERDRSGDKSYKTHLSKKISLLKKENETLSNRISNPLLSTDQRELAYQSHWLNTAIHLLTSIPEFQTVEAVSKRLQLPLPIISQHLQFLLETGYVEMVGKKYIYKNGAGHSPKYSPLTLMLHQTWRNLAVVDSQDFHSQGVHFTMVQTLSRKDFEIIKNLVLETITKINRIADPSSPEELMVFSCDVFSPR